MPCSLQSPYIPPILGVSWYRWWAVELGGCLGGGGPATHLIAAASW